MKSQDSKFKINMLNVLMKIEDNMRNLAEN